MKKYYQTLNKEEKKKIKEAYIKEYGKSDLDIRLTRLGVYTLISYISAIIILGYSIFIEEEKLGSIIIASTLFIVGTVFIIGKYRVKLDVLNKIALKKKKNK